MNNNFTKEYIKECDCEEIQRLRKKLKVWDLCFDRFYKFKIDILMVKTLPNKFWKTYAMSEQKYMGADYSRNRGKVVWLPTGDQLDEEIVRISEKSYWSYRISVFYSPFVNWRCGVFKPQEEFTELYVLNSNPLIAKIKLLKQLLK